MSTVRLEIPTQEFEVIDNVENYIHSLPTPSNRQHDNSSTLAQIDHTPAVSDKSSTPEKLKGWFSKKSFSTLFLAGASAFILVVCTVALFSGVLPPCESIGVMTTTIAYWLPRSE